MRSVIMTPRGLCAWLPLLLLLVPSISAEAPAAVPTAATPASKAGKRAAAAATPASSVIEIVDNDDDEKSDGKDEDARLSKKVKPPALRRQSAARDAVLGVSAAAATAADVTEPDVDDDDSTAEAAAAPKEPLFGRRQIATLALVLFLRIGLAVWKAISAKAGSEGGGGMPGAAIVAKISSLFAPLNAFHEWITELARSPQSAPIMLGLLIVGVKLVKHFDPDMQERDDDAADMANAGAVVAEEEQPEEGEQHEQEVEELEEVEDDEEGDEDE